MYISGLSSPVLRYQTVPGEVTIRLSDTVHKLEKSGCNIWHNCHIVDFTSFASHSVVAQRPLLGRALLVAPFGNFS